MPEQDQSPFSSREFPQEDPHPERSVSRNEPSQLHLFRELIFFRNLQLHALCSPYQVSLFVICRHICSTAPTVSVSGRGAGVTSGSSFSDRETVYSCTSHVPLHLIAWLRSASLALIQNPYTETQIIIFLVLLKEQRIKKNLYHLCHFLFILYLLCLSKWQY